MLPATVTPAAVLGAAGTTVGGFDDVILLVAGLALGIFVVGMIIRRVKRAK